MYSAPIVTPASIRDLPLEKKLRWPVSVALMRGGDQLIVSRYGDDVWDFWPYLPHENKNDSRKKIQWSIDLGNGTRLTAPENALLLRSCKDFTWAYFAEPVEGRKRPSMTTVIKQVTRSMTILLKWMVRCGFTQFRQIDGHSMEYVAHARSGVNVQTAWDRLALLEKLYLQREKLADALQVHPWPFDTSASLSGLATSPDRYKPKTFVIPDRVLRKLGMVAIDYLENQAGRILDVRDQIATCEDKHKSVYLPEVGRYQRGATLIAQGLGYPTARDHSRDLANLKTACYVVIAMFSGIRDSELLSLSANCIVHGMPREGIELTWLCGTIYKTGIRPKKWVVPPIVETAVQVMERLSAPLRSLLSLEEQTLIALPSRSEVQVKRLQAVTNQKDKLFLATDMGAGNRVAVACTSVKQLRKFCERHSITDDDGRLWPIAPHQFRRTFAYNYAKNQMGDLMYLKEHFGHVGLDMTLLYADEGTDEYEADTDLVTMIAEAKHDRHVEILSNIVESDRPVANGSAWVGEWRRTIRTAPNKEQLIDELADTLSLTGTGHSWCAGSAKGTGCGSRCLFEPDMCVDCNWAIISDEHLPVWEEIASQQETVIACEDIGLPGKVRAQRILTKAQETIAKLEGRVGHAEG
ncbi:tyrosine-type recombinase/integrase [Burkholderia glumae]|uniref:tyrosine-type recombinase/integrase n=1 Tax=Burkholderia glumae TaxID=337 RepID=UPI00148EDE8C|nr:tyrosine-type recombinase/integrase [Burkholderia glumae]QJW82558.1 tyrosine-type recombinase/integrase [Burkholderia glumae]